MQLLITWEAEEQGRILEQAKLVTYFKVSVTDQDKWNKRVVTRGWEGPKCFERERKLWKQNSTVLLKIFSMEHYTHIHTKREREKRACTSRLVPMEIELKTGPLHAINPTGYSKPDWQRERERCDILRFAVWPFLRKRNSLAWGQDITTWHKSRHLQVGREGQSFLLLLQTLLLPLSNIYLPFLDLLLSTLTTKATSSKTTPCPLTCGLSCSYSDPNRWVSTGHDLVSYAPIIQ